MLDYFFLPGIGLAIGLWGLFFDARKNLRSVGTTLLIVMMAASAIYTGWSSWNKSLASAHAAQTAETRAAKVQTNLDKALTALANLDVRAVNVASQVGRVDSAVTSISAQVEKLGQALGIRPENQSPEKISQGLKAAQATASIATPAVKQGNAGITIQYFPKDLDRDLIQSVLLNNLQNAGFALKSGNGNPTLKHTPTNSVWYGAQVPAEAVRLVALSLLQSGVQVQSIAPLSDASNPAKARLIQIGSLAAALDKPVYTVEQISQFNPGH
ncbi:hypothetical protein JCM19000A_26630 [Silvimonas sp. JCM 19000]